MTSASIDARGTTRHRAQRTADSRDERLLHHRIDLRPILAVVQRRADLDERARTPSSSAASSATCSRTSNSLAARRSPTTASTTSSTTGRTRWRWRWTRRSSSPQQYYLIGYVQDSWRASDRLTLELGLRYDFYSVVKEKNGNAKPFFIEENDFSSRPGQFLRSGQEQLRAASIGGLPDRRQNGVPNRVRALLRPGSVRGSHPAD